MKIEVEDRSEPYDSFLKEMRAAPIRYVSLRVQNEQTGEARQVGFSADRNGNFLDSDTMCFKPFGEPDESMICRLAKGHEGHCKS